MRSKSDIELEAMRRRLAEQNEQLERAKELIAARRGVLPAPPEALAAIERACDVTLPAPCATERPRHAGAIRA